MAEKKSKSQISKITFHKIAGVLTIINAVIISGLAMFFFSIHGDLVPYFIYFVAIFVFLASVLNLVSGYYMLNRRHFRLAIISVLVALLIGILTPKVDVLVIIGYPITIISFLALIFTILSKKEFI
jgi:hypothetical protein